MENKRFFTIEDNQTLIYFQLPKVLMIAERYKKLSNDAKLLYVYYLDLNKKSMKHNWKDKEGRYYIKFSDEKAMEFIGCAKQKLSQLKKALREFELIHTKRLGQGMVDITYVLKLEYTDEDVYKVEEEFDNVADDANEKDQKAEVRKSNFSTESNEVRKSNSKKCENQTSRSMKIEGLEVRKSNSINKNNLSDIDSSENDSIENNLNLNLNIVETLWDTSLPMELKRWIKVKIYEKSLSISNEQILLLDDAYKYQINKGWIISDCDSEYIGAISDKEFTGSISKMLDTVNDIHNMKGLVQSWVQKAYDFKVTNLTKPIYERQVPFYNWLED
ncbi:replication initiator protein A [Bacillus paranthracis]|uniref:replication initiator protein A n=1 Tax=Bacillus paranthracis TaxID=2026186 RepID=UPI0037CBA9AE